jgi:tetratricopeptide (TPR) repeat protein
MSMDEGDDIDDRIRELEEQSNKFHEDLKYLEAIDTLEELLALKKERFGTTGPEFTETCRQLWEICNILAVFYLKKDDLKSALDLLKKSEVLWENNDLGKAMTYNNMACYYRRVGKLRTALKFLEQALSIEGRLNKIDTQADTHLNIWAVLSQLNKHELALNHAMSAVILLQEDLLFKAVNGDRKKEEETKASKPKSGKDQNKDRTSVLAIAYHNMGVEQEFLRSYHAAILSYKKAVNFAEKNLGPNDGITENLRNVYENARSELDPSFKKKKPSGKKKAKNPRGPQSLGMDDEDEVATEEQKLEDHHSDDNAQEMEGEGEEV